MAYPNPWADPAAPNFATAPYVEPVYQVWAYRGILPILVDGAWDITVELDGGRAPYGTARFKVATQWRDSLFDPHQAKIVHVSAGWRYNGTINSNRLFSGIVTERRMRFDPAGGSYIEITAESFETILEYPSHLAVGVSTSYTKLKQFYDANGFYRKPTWEEPASNATPTAGQLAEYRALGIDKDDDVGDWHRTAASTLGQWLRGHMDSTTPKVECITDPYPYDRLLTLPASAFTDLERVENLDGWANIVRLTAQWTYNTAGDTKSKRRTYIAAGVSGGTGPVRARDLTLNIRPPGGNNPPANWSPALRWLRRLNESQLGTWSGTMRALWWLQPRIDAIQLTGAELEATPGAVQRVTYLVDQGLMNLTWNLT